ncbi:MAG: SxtJ family membrane protein, partial [Bacteroidota bacterium]
MAPTRSDREKREVYSTVLVLGLALLLAFAYWDEIALFYGAIGLLALTLVWYLPVYYLHRAWMYLARGLAWINTRILLGIIFFLILLPLARLRS